MGKCEYKIKWNDSVVFIAIQGVFLFNTIPIRPSYYNRALDENTVNIYF